MQEKIAEFCSIKTRPAYKNGKEPTERFNYLCNLCDQNGLKYEVDVFPLDKKNNLFNLVLLGSGDKMLIAHHDICNPNSENANDDATSVLNCLSIKRDISSVNVVITDCEEYGHEGAKRLAEQIVNGSYGNIDWVLNLELTGKGGETFFMGNYPGKLFNLLKERYNPLVINTPPSDTVALRAKGIDSVVVTTLDKKDDKDYQKAIRDIKQEEISFLMRKKKAKGSYIDQELDHFNWLKIKASYDFTGLYSCHKPTDTVSNISVEDMKIFCEKVVKPLL